MPEIEAIWFETEEFWGFWPHTMDVPLVFSWCSVVEVEKWLCLFGSLYIFVVNGRDRKSVV